MRSSNEDSIDNPAFLIEKKGLSSVKDKLKGAGIYTISQLAFCSEDFLVHKGITKSSAMKLRKESNAFHKTLSNTTTKDRGEGRVFNVVRDSPYIYNILKRGPYGMSTHQILTCANCHLNSFTKKALVGSNIDQMAMDLENKAKWLRNCKHVGPAKAVYMLLYRGFIAHSDLTEEAGMRKFQSKEIIRTMIGQNMIQSCEYGSMEHIYMSYKPHIFDYHLKTMRIYRLREEAYEFLSNRLVLEKIDSMVQNENLRTFCEKERKAFETFKNGERDTSRENQG